MERIDLHTHTLASDGSDTPADRRAARRRQLGLRAVADHGSRHVRRPAGGPRGGDGAAASRSCPVWSCPPSGAARRCICSATIMDTGNAALRALMTRATDERNARNETMVQRLHDAGYPITMDGPARGLPGADGARPAAHRGAARAARVHPLGVRRYARPARPGQGAFTSRAITSRSRIPSAPCARRAACRSWRIIFKYRFDDAQRAALLAAAADAGALGRRGALHDLYARADGDGAGAGRALRPRALRRLGLSRPAQAGHRPRLRPGRAARAVCVPRRASKPLPGTNVCDTRTEFSPFFEIFPEVVS